MYAHQFTCFLNRSVGTFLIVLFHYNKFWIDISYIENISQNERYKKSFKIWISVNIFFANITLNRNKTDLTAFSHIKHENPFILDNSTFITNRIKYNNFFVVVAIAATTGPRSLLLPSLKLLREPASS